MHECGNLIQHEGEGARGLYVVTARVHYPYSTGWGALTGLYPTVVTSTSVRAINNSRTSVNFPICPTTAVIGWILCPDISYN